MEASIVIKRRAGCRWDWTADGEDKDMFGSAENYLSKLARNRKKAMVFFSTKKFSGAKKLIYVCAGWSLNLTWYYATYKLGGKKIDICTDWLRDNLGATRKIIYAKIMWVE